ncbi:MAG: PfkB family carbohydrate kinase [Hyphomicrobiales bacterium]
MPYRSKGPRAFIIGNATLDVTFEVEAFPRPGETIIARAASLDLGGKGANQAVVLHRCGIATRLVAALGEDSDGDEIARLLTAEGLDGKFLLRRPVASDRSFILVDAGGENVIVSSAAAAQSIGPAGIPSALAGGRRGDVLVMQGNLKLETTKAALRQAKARGMQTLLNPAPLTFKPDRLLPYTDCLVVNRLEAAELSGTSDAGAAAKRLLAKGAGQVVVTLGSEGAILAGPAGFHRAAAAAARVVDTVAAGDTVCGVVGAILAIDGRLRPGGLVLALAAAGLAVGRKGALSAIPSRNELARLFAKHRRASSPAQISQSGQ